ncbi:MAG: metallophosphoesterase, partial [Verrucomicrobiota bacterium]
MINTYTNDPEFQSITLHTGDWVQNGNRETDWANYIFDPYYANTHEFQANMPLNGTRGNHEDSGVLFEKYFPYPYEPDGMYWSFDYGPAHITVIDEYTKFCPGYPQNTWLENDLASSSKKWKFIVLHEPGWSVGQNNAYVQQCIQPLAVKYGVDVIFNGHNHCYAHAVVDGIHHVTTGGGGGDLFAPDPDAEYVVKMVKEHHFMEVAMEGDNLSLTARDTGGYELDSFQLTKESTSFAVIGDFGSDDSDLDELDVANLVASWSPDYVVTVGDNRYDPASMDTAVGKYYCDFLADAGFGTAYCDGGNAVQNAFFPSLGNHDYTDGGGINEYLNYFSLPGAGIETTGTSGNEKYYDFIQGPVHFFVINSYESSTFAAQQTWLQEQLAASTTPWQVVYFHHAAYSSGNHGSSVAMRWPFADWGADAVFAGHDHTYERLEVDGIPYIVNGLGGMSRYSFDTPLPESIVRYNSNYGAMLVDADEASMTFQFINVAGTVIDSHTVQAGGTTPPPDNDGVIDKRIIYSGDDVEQRTDTGGMYMDSTDLELVDDLVNHGPQSVGLRFQGLDIPQGATLTAAYIEFTVDETTSEATDVQFQTQAVDHAEPFTTTAFNLTDRPWNPDTVSWSIPAWSSVGTKQQSPDITAMVQEVVNRSGWSSGNSMVFLISGAGKRVAEAFDGAPAAAPLLHIEFDTDGSANAAPTAAFASVNSDLMVDFTDSSSDSDGQISSWAWDFGDGNSSSVQNPSHTYGAAGTYTVTLTVTDNDGATDIASASVTVTEPPPVNQVPNAAF